MLLQRNLGYQSDLMSQVSYTSGLKNLEADERQRELEIENQAEHRYQTKLRSALDRPTIDRAHPLRKYQDSQSRLFG